MEMFKNIMLVLLVVFVAMVYFRGSKNDHLIDINLENQQKIIELTDINRNLLEENAEYRVQRLEIDKLENEVKIFYDSLYVTHDTSVEVKDSVLSNFLRQYDNLIGSRLH